MPTPKRSDAERASIKQGGGDLRYKNENQLLAKQEKELKKTKEWMEKLTELE